MSETYKITDVDGDELEVLPIEFEGDLPCIITRRAKLHTAAYFTPEQAPALALAILEAGGVAERAKRESHWGPSEHAWNLLKTQITEAAKDAEAEAARDRRRDELAKELYATAFGDENALGYHHRSPMVKVAIDRIIELEAK